MSFLYIHIDATNILRTSITVGKHGMLLYNDDLVIIDAICISLMYLGKV